MEFFSTWAKGQIDWLIHNPVMLGQRFRPDITAFFTPEEAFIGHALDPFPPFPLLLRTTLTGGVDWFCKEQGSLHLRTRLPVP